MFTAAHQMLREFYHKNKKKKKEKKICTYDSLIQLGPGLQSLVWGCDSDETRAALKRQHITPNRSSKETGESA